MALHLIKLCVGCDSITDLEQWIEENRALHRRLGREYEQTHTTRMVPKRVDELLDICRDLKQANPLLLEAR